MKTAVLKRYVEIQATLRELEAEKAELAEGIVADLDKQGLKTLETKLGNFTRAVRLSYTYSDKVKKAEIDLKAIKEKEVVDGIAEARETAYLAFKATP